MPVKLKKNTTTLLNLKVTSDERKELAKNAKKFAGGNLSLWLRFAGLNHIPRKKDLK